MPREVAAPPRLATAPAQAPRSPATQRPNPQSLPGVAGLPHGVTRHSRPSASRRSRDCAISLTQRHGRAIQAPVSGDLLVVVVVRGPRLATRPLARDFLASFVRQEQRVVQIGVRPRGFIAHPERCSELPLSLPGLGGSPSRPLLDVPWGLPWPRRHLDGLEEGAGAGGHGRGFERRNSGRDAHATQNPDTRGEPIALKNSSCALNEVFGSATYVTCFE